MMALELLMKTLATVSNRRGCSDHQCSNNRCSGKHDQILPANGDLHNSPKAKLCLGPEQGHRYDMATEISKHQVRSRKGSLSHDVAQVALPQNQAVAIEGNGPKVRAIFLDDSTKTDRPLTAALLASVAQKSRYRLSLSRQNIISHPRRPSLFDVSSGWTAVSRGVSRKGPACVETRCRTEAG
jgi:hypothetical protein